MANQEKLTSLSDIYRFFRKNTLPIFFISPTAYNVLGLGQWVKSFRYISYFDSFDGYHHRILNPQELGDREFSSMEEIVNYLLSHKETYDLVQSLGGKGKMMTVMFDDETERLAEQLGLEIALPPAELRDKLDSKIITTQLGNEAGVPSAPNAMGKASSYVELQWLCNENDLGDDLVVQTPYGDSGKTTFFIKNEEDWKKAEKYVVGEELKVMKRINHIPYTLEAVATRCGTLVGPAQFDITGFEELTPYKGGWAGNDIDNRVLTEKQRKRVVEMAKAMGDRLYKEGYKGTFCFDFLIDTDNDEVYMGEINPRVSGASPMTNLVTSKYGGAPLMMFHLLEYMDVDFEFDVDQVQSRWSDFDTWTQLVMKQTKDEVEQITKAPLSGIWSMQPDGRIRFMRRSIDWHNVGDENEAFYMRVHGVGEYMYHGADIGILVTRGRMQTDDRELTDRAKAWISAIHGEFETTPLPPAVEIAPPEMGIKKMM